MGGKALKTVPTRRYDNKEFYETWEMLKAKLSTCKEITRFDLVKSYKNKETHGDMDILVGFHPGRSTNALMAEINLLINPDETYHNDSVISMNFYDLQVDIMLVSDDDFDLRWHFFAFNDLGGFMGKVARSMKCKYGQKGLVFDIFEEGTKLKLDTISICKDPKTIIEFLGFDYYRFVRGFDSKEEIFQYVYDSEYFRKATFDGSELNHSQRSRDMGRSMYEDLLAWMEGKEDSGKERPCLDEITFLINDNDDIPVTRLDQKISNVRFAHKRKKDAAHKFNGKLVMAKFNLVAGPEFGEIMRCWIVYLDNCYDDPIEHILRTSTDDLFEEFYEINGELWEQD